eukprot:TRINITY_DN9195_c0_g1_i4.p1 TRINITY_DN9195_c0_g1~~TRINITY_DN9195_c0_g1_i4.p1  ORF type:complete len:153 (+),score=7.15 TRINITY_DN9195_c0_g1_i4:334-792(+)
MLRVRVAVAVPPQKYTRLLQVLCSTALVKDVQPHTIHLAGLTHHVVRKHRQAPIAGNKGVVGVAAGAKVNSLITKTVYGAKVHCPLFAPDLQKALSYDCLCNRHWTGFPPRSKCHESSITAGGDLSDVALLASRRHHEQNMALSSLPAQRLQ